MADDPLPALGGQLRQLGISSSRKRSRCSGVICSNICSVARMRSFCSGVNLFHFCEILANLRLTRGRKALEAVVVPHEALLLFRRHFPYVFDPFRRQADGCSRVQPVPCQPGPFGRACPLLRGLPAALAAVRPGRTAGPAAREQAAPRRSRREARRPAESAKPRMKLRTMRLLCPLPNRWPFHYPAASCPAPAQPAPGRARRTWSGRRSSRAHPGPGWR